MSTGGISRRAAIRTLGAGAGAITFLPWLSEEGLSAFAEVQKAGTAPALKVLTSAQYRTVEALVEAIIPADERSPGAKEARVADYIDLALSEAHAPQQKEWLDGLEAMDVEARKRFGAPFVRLEASQVEALLTDISAFEKREKDKAPDAAPDATHDISRSEQPKEKPVLVEGLFHEVHKMDPKKPRTVLEAFFAATKRATVHGYYTSEIGIHQELRYKGNQLLAEFVGCATVDGKDCPHCGQKAGA
ncbi:MAG TPA: gluconate 2-dehydrogenase subunit 3 family protein [Vicinamibacteria bacterium]|nr:gluconate 2-dehydrogenase subunit 3 family protein [Vicinamibacteria bacterium]